MTDRLLSRTVARLVGGGVIAALALAGTGAGIVFGWVPHRVTPLSESVAPAAADPRLACAGPLLAIGRDASAAGAISVAAPEEVTSWGAGRQQDVLGVPGVPGASGPVRLFARAQGRTVPALSGASSASVGSPDMAGFAASACAPALMQSWIVGGSTTTGAADLLLLANPGTVPATVDLTLYSATGPQTPGAGANIVVAPGTQRVVPLAGLGLGQQAPVVRVTATGAPVRAALQSSITRGLTPGGVDHSGAVAIADTTQVIPGVRVTGPPQNDPTTILRLLAPGARTAATITVVGEHGPAGAPMTVSLPAGSPAEIEVPGLAPGTYTVTVESAAPVVGAVWQSTGPGDDFAWLTAVPALAPVETGTLFAVAAGPSPQLAVVPAASEPATITVTPAAGGPARSATAQPGRTTTLPLSPGAAYRITSDHAVRAAVTFAGAGELAGYPVWAQDAASAPVPVYP